MQFLPRRHWFRFRLTTWFVLIAILAWAMVEWPWIIRLEEWASFPTSAIPPTNFHRKGTAFAGVVSYSFVSYRLNSAILWPVVVLAALLFWKAAGAFRRNELRYGLRVILVGAVLASLCAYEVTWVWQRHGFLAAQAALMKKYGIGPQRFEKPRSNYGSMGYANRISWVDSLAFSVFREPRKTELYIVTGLWANEPDYLPDAERLFPEAEVIHWAREPLLHPEPDLDLEVRDVIFD
jgi:hypothetical protein